VTRLSWVVDRLWTVFANVHEIRDEFSKAKAERPVEDGIV